MIVEVKIAVKSRLIKFKASLKLKLKGWIKGLILL
jgi:hypothetical protein